MPRAIPMHDNSSISLFATMVCESQTRLLGTRAVRQVLVLVSVGCRINQGDVKEG